MADKSRLNDVLKKYGASYTHAPWEANPTTPNRSAERQKQLSDTIGKYQAKSIVATPWATPKAPIQSQQEYNQQVAKVAQNTYDRQMRQADINRANYQQALNNAYSQAGYQAPVSMAGKNIMTPELRQKMDEFNATHTPTTIGNVTDQPLLDKSQRYITYTSDPNYERYMQKSYNEGNPFGVNWQQYAYDKVNNRLLTFGTRPQGSTEIMRYLTTDEQNQYSYIWGKEGKTAADKFLAEITPEVSKRASEEESAKALAEAKEDPVTGIARSVYGDMVGSLGGAAGMMVNTADKWLGNKKPNEYDSTFMLTRQAQASQEGAKQGIYDSLPEGSALRKEIPVIGRPTDFAVSTGVSMVESALRALTGSALIGGIQGGLSAASSAYVDSIDKGFTHETAMQRAIAQGIAEEFFEEYSLDKLLSIKSPSSVRAFLKQMVGQGSVEGSEEVFTDIANSITDDFILGKQSELQQNVDMMVKNGVPKEKALAEAGKTYLVQLLGSFAGGFVSGLGLGSGKQLADVGMRGFSTVNPQNATDIVNNIDTNRENYASDESYNTAQEMLKQAQNVQDKTNEGKKLSFDDKLGYTAAEQEMLMMPEGQYNENGSFPKGDTISTEMAESLNKALDNKVVDKESLLNKYGVKSVNEMNTEQASNLITDIASLESKPYNDVKVKENTNESGSRIEQRTDGMDGAGESAGVPESTGETEVGDTERSGADDIRAYAEANGRLTSARENGIKNGTRNTTARTVPNSYFKNADTGYAKDLRDTYEQGQADNVSVSYFTGNFEIDENGSRFMVRGAADGNRIFIRADHPYLTPRQIYDHEYFHVEARRNPNLVNEARQKVLDKYGSGEELFKAVQAYAQAFYGSGMTSDEIFEEFLADSYAGIDPGQSIARYQSEVGEAVKDSHSKTIEEAKQYPNNASAKSLKKSEVKGLKKVEGKRQFSRETDSSGNTLSENQLDSSYLKAVESNDMETAQKMVDEKAKEVANSEEVSNALYIVNKLAKAYGYGGSSINYRQSDIYKQDELYSLKDAIVKKYGKKIATHRFDNGYGDLYKLGDNTFHLFNPISLFFSDIFKHEYVEKARYTDNLELRSGSGDLLGRLPFDIDNYDFSGKKYFDLSDKPKLEQLNKRYEKYLKLEKVKPPRDTESKISAQEEADAIRVVKNFAAKLSDPVTYDDNGNIIPLSERFNSKSDDIRYSREWTPEQRDKYLRYTADEMNWQIGKTKGIEREKANTKLKAVKEANAEKVKGLKAEGKAKLNEVKAENKAKTDTLVKQLKAEGKEKLDAQKQKYEQRLADANERRRDAVEKEREAKHKAIRNIREEHNEQILRKREMKADAKARQNLLKAINKAIKVSKGKSGFASEQIKQLVNGIDNKSVRLLSNTKEDIKKREEQILKLAAEDPDFNRLHKERMLASVRRLYDTQISDMDIEDVKTLAEDLVALTHYIENQDKFLKDEKKREISTTANAWVDELNRVTPFDKSNAFTKMYEDYLTNNMSPLRAMRRISGYAQNSVGEEMARLVLDGKTKQVALQKRFLQPFEDFMSNPANKDFVNTASEQDIPITVKGKTHYISKGMRVALYLHSLNTDNLTHIAKGGINIPDAKFYKNGNYADAYGNNIVHLTPTQLDEIVAGMTPSEREYATLMQSFFREAADEINETSLDLDGVMRALVEDYFPITSDPDFLESSVDFMQDPTIEGWGNLKARVNGSNPILLEDATKVLDRHIRKTSQYAALAVPLRNFQKVFNYTKASNDNVSFINDGVKTNYITDNANEALVFSSVQKAMKNAWDKNTVKYVQNFLKDVNSGGRKADAGLFEKARSAYAGAVLTLNPSVALKQTTSYFMAGSILSNKALAYGLTHKFGKADETYMDKITPWGWNRRRGQSTIELGDMAQKKGLTSKIPNWNQAMDVITTNALFIATERDIQKQFPDLKRGDAEYDKALAEKYNEVLWRTQPQYDEAFRPEYLRKTDVGSRTLGMFKTESMQMVGELLDAIGQYNADKKNGLDTTESKKTFYKTLGSWSASNLAFAAMGAVLKFALHNIKGYRDDEGEIDPNNVLKEILSGFASSSAGGFFGGSQLFDVGNYFIKKASGENAQWYDIEVPGVSIVNDLVKSAGNLATIFDKDSTPEQITKAVSRFALDVAKVTPVGFAENIYKMADAVNLYIQDIAKGKLFDGGVNLFNLKDTSVTSKQYATRTVNAFAEGDDEKGKESWNELVNNVGLDKAEDKVRTALGEEFKTLYDEKIDEGYSQTKAYEYALENGLTLANDIIANSKDENIRDIAIKTVYDIKKGNVQNPSTVEVIESLDISNADKGKVFAESTDSEKLNAWRDNGGSEYDYYVATQKLAPSIPKDDDIDPILYVQGLVADGEYTQGQADAWLVANKGNTKAYEMWKGSNEEFFKAYSEIKDIKSKKLKDDTKKAKVVSLIKSYAKKSKSPEDTARAMWEMAGYDFDSTKNKKTIIDGNFFKAFPQYKDSKVKGLKK